MDRSTVLQYSNLSAEDLETEARRAMREWMFRPGPVITFLKSLTPPRRAAFGFQCRYAAVEVDTVPRNRPLSLITV